MLWMFDMLLLQVVKILTGKGLSRWAMVGM